MLFLSYKFAVSLLVTLTTTTISHLVHASPATDELPVTQTTDPLPAPTNFPALAANGSQRIYEDWYYQMNENRFISPSPYNPVYKTSQGYVTALTIRWNPAEVVTCASHLSENQDRVKQIGCKDIDLADTNLYCKSVQFVLYSVFAGLPDPAFPDGLQMTGTYSPNYAPNSGNYVWPDPFDLNYLGPHHDNRYRFALLCTDGTFFQWSEEFLIVIADGDDGTS